MILAVMQPYLFPYIGYYQLAYHSDIFIFYDDVNYIKGGYINRNRIQTRNGPQLFTRALFPRRYQKNFIIHISIIF